MKATFTKSASVNVEILAVWSACSSMTDLPSTRGGPLVLSNYYSNAHVLLSRRGPGLPVLSPVLHAGSASRGELKDHVHLRGWGEEEWGRKSQSLNAFILISMCETLGSRPRNTKFKTAREENSESWVLEKAEDLHLKGCCLASGSEQVLTVVNCLFLVFTCVCLRLLIPIRGTSRRSLCSQMSRETRKI